MKVLWLGISISNNCKSWYSYAYYLLTRLWNMWNGTLWVRGYFYVQIFISFILIKFWLSIRWISNQQILFFVYDHETFTNVWDCGEVIFDTTGNCKRVVFTYKWFNTSNIFKLQMVEINMLWCTIVLLTS